jgi:hypothetical protein
MDSTIDSVISEATRIRNKFNPLFARIRFYVDLMIPQTGIFDHIRPITSYDLASFLQIVLSLLNALEQASIVVASISDNYDIISLEHVMDDIVEGINLIHLLIRLILPLIR